MKMYVKWKKFSFNKFIIMVIVMIMSILQLLYWTCDVIFHLGGMNFM